MAVLLPFPFGSEVFVLLPTFLMFFGHGCCKLDHSFLKVFSSRFPDVLAPSKLTEYWGGRSRTPEALGTADPHVGGAGRGRGGAREEP